MNRAEDLFNRLVSGGGQEVSAFIAEPVTEELFLDYKRSADNGAGKRLHNDDQKNLAKAISGFGNSEGGVVLWGVACRNDPVLGDVPTHPVPIENPNRFKSWLEQKTSGLTIPPHSGVRHHVVPEGYVVTLVPSGAHAPYQTVNGLSYYIRAGSSFVRAPHGVLAGLFGRRPQADIQLNFIVHEPPSVLALGVVKTSFGIVVHNFGRGIAEDIFLNLEFRGTPGQRCELKLLPSEDSETWSARSVFGHRHQMLTRPGIRLPPSSELKPATVEVMLANPIEHDFSIEGLCGSSGSEPHVFRFSWTVAELIDAFDQLSKTPADAIDFEMVGRRFSKSFVKGFPR